MAKSLGISIGAISKIVGEADERGVTLDEWPACGTLAAGPHRLVWTRYAADAA